jgi:hypothetical protein
LPGFDQWLAYVANLMEAQALLSPPQKKEGHFLVEKCTQ